MRISDWSSDVCSADLTPMSGILGLLDLLDTTSLDNRQRHYISLMQSASETLQTVLNDVLDFAKIEAGALTMEMRPFDLRSEERRVGKECGSKCGSRWSPHT